jgi:hypothetical protein
LFINNIFGQSKSINAVRVNEKIKIDGNFDEKSWDNAQSTNEFVGFYPVYGNSPDQLSEVKVLYDNHSIYFAAKLSDSQADSIYSEFTVRDDDEGNADYFRISLNPNNDGQNTFEFIVSAANVQTDIRNSEMDDDYDWDAVWFSAVQLTDEGWFVEVEIPYSAIRFPKDDAQKWDVNFYRTIRRSREVTTWNPIDLIKGSEPSQMGIIDNIKDIDAPLRLALMPYVSGYASSYESDWGSSFSGGMDLKLGLSETYTLDMTLIPDFGQTTSDNAVLNLTPHETYFSENRPFFTEGTELFNKCDLFYSRRIGRTPQNYEDVAEAAENGDYVIDKNPESAKLINAFKISGRGKNNLAIGIFNAVTANTWAKVTLADGSNNRILTDPASNYNIIVLDQSIGKNSYVNFTNANVIRSGQTYFSNVMATSIKLMDKKNKFGVDALASYSMQNLEGNYVADGWKMNSSIGKFTGTWIYSVGTELITDKYNSNDLGYQTEYNEINSYAEFSYRKFSQFWVFNESQNSATLFYNTLFEGKAYTGSGLEISNEATTKKHITLWNNLTIPFTDKNDYYEPRTAGRFYKRPALFSENFFISTDYRKRIAFDVRCGIYFDRVERNGLWLSLSPITRIGKRFSLRYSISSDFDMGASGYAGETDDDIIFGNRDVISFTNSVNFSYVFSNKLSLSVIARHYVSDVDYHEFFTLENDGTLTSYYDDMFVSDYNFNTFNIDLLLSWNFLPGSYLSIMWKNQMFVLGDVPETTEMPSYFDSFKQIWQESQANNFSLKLIYYLDYNSVFKK